MQWSGVQGGAAPFEPVLTQPPQPTLPTQFLGRRCHANDSLTGSREAMPMAPGGMMLEIPVTLKPRRSAAQPVQTMAAPAPEMAGSLRPLLDAQVQTRSRRSDTPEQKPTHYAPFLADPKPFQTQQSELVQKPRFLQNRPTVTREAPQFLGYGAAYAMPTEFALHSRRAEKVFDDVGMQARTFPAQQSQWERMMGWMPRHISFAEGFQTGVTLDTAKASVQRFYKLYDFARTYYLDAVFPVPKMVSNKITVRTITYIITASSEDAWRLFDDDYTSVWQPTEINPWVQIELSKATKILGIKVSKGTGNSLYFNAFRIEGSVNGTSWTQLYITTSENTTYINNLPFTVARIISFNQSSIAYKFYKIFFTGKGGSGTPASMHTLQMYGGDLKDDSLANIVNPWEREFVSFSDTGDYLSLNENANSLGSDSIKAYRFYKWDIESLKDTANSVQVSRFRFLLEDGSEYKWKTDDIGNSLEKSQLGDFAINPSGSNPGGTQLNADFSEHPRNLIINGKLPDDLSANGALINTSTKKWLDFDKGDVVFVLQTAQLFLSYKWATGNDSVERDPLKWTFYGSDANPFNDNLNFSESQNKNSADFRTNPTWVQLNTYNFPGTNARGDYQGPFLMYKNHTGMQLAFNTAYKELCKLILDKFNAIRIEALLTQDTTPTDQLSCITKSSSALQLKDVQPLSNKTTIDNIQVYTINNNQLTLSAFTDITTIMNSYITFGNTMASNTGHWVALYTRIKCLALTPINEYIDYMKGLETVSLPTEFPTLLVAESLQKDINNTTSIVSIVTIIDSLNQYRILIKKARAYFPVKQYQELFSYTSGLLHPITEVAPVSFTGSTLSDVTTLWNANKKAVDYTTIANGILTNLNKDNTQNVQNTYTAAINSIGRIILNRFRSVYDTFKTYKMAEIPALNTAYSVADPAQPPDSMFTTSKTFVTTHFPTLRQSIRDFLNGYNTKVNSIRTWVTSVNNCATSNNCPDTSRTITLENIKTTGIGIVTTAQSLTTLGETLTLNQLEAEGATSVAAMAAIIGTNVTTTGTVRHGIDQKINEVVAYYSLPANDPYLTSYAWIAEQNVANKATVSSTTALSTLIELWNKYNIMGTLRSTVEGGQQLLYQGIIRDYNALYDAYVAFYKNNNTFFTGLAQLPSNFTRDNDTVTIGSSGNYATMVAKYGSSTTGMFKNLIDFVKGQIRTYIPAFYEKYLSLDKDNDTRDDNIDKTFYSIHIKEADEAKVTLTVSPLSLNLVTLLREYNVYTEQYKARDDRYNTLVQINHYLHLITNNSSTSKIFPSTGTLSVSQVSTDISGALEAVEASAPSITLGLSPSPSPNEALQLTLSGLRTKYRSEFSNLFNILKSNMLGIISEYESLHDAYNEFQTGFTSFSPMVQFNGLKIQTTSGTPVELLSKLLAETMSTPDSPNQFSCITRLDVVRDRYFSSFTTSPGVYVSLIRHVNAQLVSFQTTLIARMNSSLVAVAEKPELPNGSACT